MPSYQDFIIDLGPAAAGEHSVRILESPSGNAQGSFKSPLGNEEMLEWFGGMKRARSTRLRDLVAFKPRRMRPTTRGVGEKLFAALFQGEVRDRYVSSVARIRAADEGLRITIRIDPDDAAAARLHSLPWEYLYHPEARRFLARSRRSPVVRYLDVPEPADLPPVPRPLRILMVMANPTDTEPLALEQERQAIAKVWRDHPIVEIEFLPRDPAARASARALRAALLEKEFHVLHFMGHGGFDRETGLGTLFFENQQGGSDPISGGDLAELLDDFKSLRLVVVNACHSAKAADDEGRNPFTGVATALVQGGLPAVLAMQAAISDQAAIAFSREFYHRLAAGDSIDAAVVEGRRSIGRPDETDEWGLPVLFLRAREGRLYEQGSQPAQIDRPPSWSWNMKGAVCLGVGLVGVALVLGFGYLYLEQHVALRKAMVVVAGLIGTLFAFLFQRDPIPAHLLSHWVARNGMARWGFCLGGFVGVAGWVLAGPWVVRRSECGELSSPPGVQRVAVGSFQNLLGEPGGLSWPEETQSFLQQALRLQDGVWPLEESLLPEEPMRRCIDVTIQGTIKEAGQDIVLSAELFRRGGVNIAAVEARGTPGDLDGSLQLVQRRLALEILRALGLDPEPNRQRILEFPTADPEALELNRLGVVNFLQEDFFTAEVRFEAASERDPNYADAVNHLGMVKLEQGEYADATLHFKRAIELLPSHPSYHYNLGLALGLGGQPEAAVAAYEEAIRLDPTHARAHNNLGFVWLALGDLNRALKSLKRSLTYAQDESLQAAVYKNLGRVAREQKKYDQGLQHLEKATKLYRPYPEALFYFAMTFEDLGRASEACDAWRSYRAVADRDDDPERRREGEKRAETLDCS